MTVPDKDEIKKAKKEFASIAKQLVQSYKSREQAEFSENVPEIRERNFRQRYPAKEKQPIRRIILYSVCAAASILLLFVGRHLCENQPEKSDRKNLSAYMHEYPTDPTSNEIQLYTSDSILNVREDECVKYGKDGKLVLESSQSGEQSITNKAKSETAYNQIVVPKGKRMSLVLSDGTKIRINAGSQLVYPTVFTKEKREIYVEGEIYLDVKRDESCPFIVKTSQLDVRVLGTSFNVSAYKEDKETSIVLVSGKVEVKTKKNDKTELQPNERLCYSEDKLEKSIVDPYEYICWTQSIMLLNSESLEVVFRKLSRYYGLTIQYDKPVSEITISGKLDLKEDWKNVIDIIAFTAPISISYKENNIIISEKENK